MKIALLGTINHFGGGPRIILELAKRWDKNNIIVDIITDSYEKEKTFKDFEKFSVKALNPLNKPLLRRYTLAKKLLEIDLSEYDACISNTFYTNLTAAKNKNVIVYIHTARLPVFSIKWSTYTGIMRYIDFTGYLPLKGMEIKAVKNSAKVIANSFFVKEKIDKYYGISSEVVHPGVSVSDFYSRPSEDFCIYVGRIDPSKRVELIIEAWKYIEDDLKLYIIGEGKKEYIHKLRSMNVKTVFFTGPLQGGELKEMYARCLCTIYVPREEDFGVVPLEAMASGKPVIVANEGGLRETVREGIDGFLIEAEPKIIAKKVNFLNENREIVEKMGENAKLRAKEFDLDKQAERLLGFIKNRLNKDQ